MDFTKIFIYVKSPLVHNIRLNYVQYSDVNQCPSIEYICMNSKVYCRHYCISTLLCSRGSTISYISNGYTLMEEADIRESWQGLGRDWLNINMFKYLISSDVILRFITMFEPFRDLNLYSFGKIILS